MIRKEPDKEGFTKFMELPFELQVAVWIEALNKPSIHFCTAKVILYNNNTCWAPELKTVMRSQDDSAWRGHEELAQVCDSASRAFSVAYGAGSRIEVGMTERWVAKANMLCFRATKFLKDEPWMHMHHQKIYWHLDDQTQDPRIDYTRTQSLFHGVERIGLVFAGIEPGDYWPFGTFSGHQGQRHAYSSKQLAGFIDCAPDVKEFFHVFAVRTQRKSRRAQEIRQWCKTRKSIYQVIQRSASANCLA